MGLSFSLLALSRDGALDLSRPSEGAEADAAAVVQRLFPRTPHQLTQSRPLLQTAFPPRGTPVVGVFESGVLVATRDAHLYDPGILHARYRKLTEWPDVRLLTAASVNDMFAYGRWASGELARCFSVNAVAGVVRDRGTPDPFEEQLAVDPENWLDLCNAALASVLRLQGDAAPGFAGAVPWEDVTMHVFERAHG
ncbi:hypothetical protein INN71_01705 [Nocardioides sp. ChNu-153]|uniref:DUF6928 family protein n=1 Tax=unclassified Nocardioides TaxID=2615069 RepID=UPI002404B9C4|nr:MULTISPECIES: hypothetical protein [unclassified Nocardioides]MDF9714773.1 hypothetical protein [Nocardioides sp. ChNu-99]MDN7120101.1 hypothetical protein [Nocardioides sp. ChNu-153]